VYVGEGVGPAGAHAMSSVNTNKQMPACLKFLPLSPCREILVSNYFRHLGHTRTFLLPLCHQIVNTPGG